MNPTDERDFRTFAAEATPSLLAAAGALTGAQPAAEQLVTAVLGQVARRWRSLGADPAGYAARLLHRRYAGRRHPAGSLELLALGGGAFDDPEQTAARLRHAALRQLEPRQRSLLVLRYLQGRTDAEMAEVLASTAEAVAREIDVALARLRSLRASVAGSDPGEVDVAEQARESLRELAGAVDPADLAPVALAAARWQRRTRLGAGAGATVVVLGLAAGLGATALRPEPPPPDLTGRTVVTSYADRGSWYVLDPQTGDYRRSSNGPTAISPDLRWQMARQDGRVETSAQVVSTTDPEVSTSLDTPETVLGFAWSPDSTRVAGTVLRLAGDTSVSETTGQVALFEIADQRVSVIDLELATDRVGRCCLVAWLGPDRIAVPTADPDLVVPPAPGSPPGFSASPVTDAMSVFDLTGAHLADLPIDTSEVEDADDPHAGLAWGPSEILDDGRFLLSRTPYPGVLELAAVDLADQSGRYQPLAVTLPEPPEEMLWETTVVDSFGSTALVVAWLTPDRADSFVDPATEGPPPETYFVDFDTRAVEPVDFAAELPLPAGLTAITSATFGDATRLAPGAAHRAF